MDLKQLPTDNKKTVINDCERGYTCMPINRKKESKLTNIARAEL